MSRLSQATTAVRPALKARVMIAGPSGSGKTRSGLIIATTLAEGGPILVVDTERESALTYADDFEFDHLPWRAPYHPGELGDLLIEAGEKYAVIMVDSATHFWQKEGGTVDIANRANKRGGWIEARPIQEKFVESVLGSKAHVLLCVRARTAYDYEKDDRTGKLTLRKLGMAARQDDELEFELNAVLDLDMEHVATVTKSRTTALPVGESWPGHRFGELASTYAEWLKAGEPPADAEEVADLIARLNALPERARKEAKGEWLAKLGRPETLRASQLDAARDLVSQWTDPPEQPQTSAVEGGDHPSPPTTAEEDPQPSGSEAKAATEARDEDAGAVASDDGPPPSVVAATPKDRVSDAFKERVAEAEKPLRGLLNDLEAQADALRAEQGAQEEGWSCNACGYHPGSKPTWCAAGCGSDYNEMRRATPAEIAALPKEPGTTSDSISTPTTTESVPEGAPDLMAALEASLAQAKEKTAEAVPEGSVAYTYARSTIAGHVAELYPTKTQREAFEMAELALKRFPGGPISREDLESALNAVEPAKPGDPDPLDAPISLEARAAEIASKRRRPEPAQRTLVDQS